MPPTRSAVYSRQGMPLEYDKGKLDAEFGRIERAVPQTVIRTITAAARQQSSDAVVFCDLTGGAFAFTLLLPALAGPFPFTIKKIDASGNGVTVTGTIDGVVNPVIAGQYRSITIVSDGVSWYKVAFF